MDMLFLRRGNVISINEKEPCTVLEIREIELVPRATGLNPAYLAGKVVLLVGKGSTIFQVDLLMEDKFEVISQTPIED